MEDLIRVLIADDHPLFRDGMRGLLGSLPDMEVVGEASSGEQAIKLARELQPDVILMDIKMPGTNGIEATRRIMRTNPAARVVVLTMLEDDDSVFAAMKAGARGYLLKGADHAAIRRAVEAVAHGDIILGPGVAHRVLVHFAQSQGAAPAPFPQLTAREREVLDLVARGLGNQEIARRLSISHRTARNHVSNISTKLQVSDRAQAIAAARDAGLGTNRPKAE